MALTEDQERVLWLYHDYLRQQGLTVCERVVRPDGQARHRSVLAGRGQDLVRGFAHWLEHAEHEKRPQQGQEDDSL